MKANSLIIFLGLFASCMSIHYNYKNQIDPYNVPVVQEYYLGHFDKESGRYNEVGMLRFLESILNQYCEGDVISVDGLKWKKVRIDDCDYMGCFWEPVPNPPIPVYIEGNNFNRYVKDFNTWIRRHPHFQYPPLPENQN